MASRETVPRESQTEQREIHGFFYDFNLKRYFRNPKPIAIARNIPGGSREDRKFVVRPKDNSLKCLPDLLVKRQQGGKSYGFETELLQVKTTNLQLTETIDLAAMFDSFEEIVLLKSGPHSLLVEYKISREGKCFDRESSVTEMPHHFTPESLRKRQFRTHCVPDTTITDICMGFSNNECIMFVGNSVRMGMGKTFIIWRRPTGAIAVQREICHYTCTCPIWCCSSNNFTEKFALGLQNAFSINSDDGHMFSKFISGNVRGITFSQSGNLVYCAVHNGNVVLCDLRTRETVNSQKVDKIGLDEVVLLTNERYLICGGFDGFLCKLDLRTYGKVREYIGHVHTPRKVPFSLSESHDILCATGSDNITRLWSLNDGGEPLNYLLPPTEGSICRSCLVTDGTRASVCVTQKKKAMMYGIFT